MNNNLSGITEDALVMHENSMVFGGEITDFRTLETSLPYDASDNINLLRQQFPKYTSEHLDFIKSKMNEKVPVFGLIVNTVSRSYKIYLYKNKHTGKIELIEVQNTVKIKSNFRDDTIEVMESKFMRLFPEYILYNVGITDLESFLKNKSI